MENLEPSTAGRIVLLIAAGFVLLSICYFALGHAQASAEAAIDADCMERTVDGGLFAEDGVGMPTVVCATELVPSSSRVRSAQVRSSPH